MYYNSNSEVLVDIKYWRPNGEKMKRLSPSVLVTALFGFATTRDA